MLIKVLLHPLHKLQIILQSSLNQLLDIDVLINVALLKALLKNLEIGDRFVLKLGFSVDFMHWYFPSVNHIEELAVYGTVSALLNVVQGKLEEG